VSFVVQDFWSRRFPQTQPRPLKIPLMRLISYFDWLEG
jgi:hypothetical protein